MKNLATLSKICLVAVVAFIISCDKNTGYDSSDLKITETSTLDEDNWVLEELYQEIYRQSTMHECDDAEKWNFTPIGHKACGGPTHYIAYSSKVDTVKFLKMVSYYTAQQETYVVKWNIVSDCMAVAAPKGIDCIDGKPEFTY